MLPTMDSMLLLTGIVVSLGPTTKKRFSASPSPSFSSFGAQSLGVFAILLFHYYSPNRNTTGGYEVTTCILFNLYSTMELRQGEQVYWPVDHMLNIDSQGYPKAWRRVLLPDWWYDWKRAGGCFSTLFEVIIELPKNSEYGSVPFYLGWG